MKEPLRLPASALAGSDLGAILGEHLAVAFEGVLGAAECAAYARGVLEARSDWTSNFDGVQFTLGRAWYTHLEEDLEDEYFTGARASDAAVERACPGLQRAVLGAMSTLVGATVAQRDEWCGPGVHIFPAGQLVARQGGEVHFDTEGLTDEQLGARTAALTVVLMLQPPQRGGALRVWDRLFDGDLYPKADPRLPRFDVDYGIGDLVVIDSYRMHQIAPFGGPRDRISATAHAVLADGVWEAWF